MKAKLRRNPWPIAIVSYFAVFITCMAGWITFAVRNDMDLVRKDYYDHEIRFQDQIEKTKATAPVAGDVSIEYRAMTRAIAVRLPAHHQGAKGEIHLYRPSDAKLDQRIPLAVGDTSSQLVNAAGLQSGYWKMFLSWNADGQEFYHEKALTIGE